MIGVFDSGLGGLTVLRAIRKKVSQYDYLYLGDTLHVPYGNRSPEAIRQLTEQGVRFLFDSGATLVILACNSATAESLRFLQQKKLPKWRKIYGQHCNILGVVRPIAEYFATNNYRQLGVIGTRATIGSDVYSKEIEKSCSANYRKIPKLFSLATPLLVPIIEENFFKQKESSLIINFYLKILRKKKIDSLILGCTHYPLIIKKIRAIMGESCFVPDPAVLVGDSLQKYLERHPDKERMISRGGKVDYFVTEVNSNYLKVAQTFLRKKITLRKINLTAFEN